MKDSSSDVSPRDSVSTGLADRRRQRRAHRSPADQQYDNQAFAADERPLPPTVERAVDDDDEEENIQQADRLGSHVVKEHNRIKNEVQQKNKKSKKKTTTTTSDDVDHDKAELDRQIQEQQENISKHVDDKVVHDDDDDRVLPMDSVPPLGGTTGGKSLQQILERARRSNAGRSIDDG